MAQVDTVTFEYNHASFSAVTYVYGWPVLITHSWGAAFTVSEKSKNTCYHTRRKPFHSDGFSQTYEYNK